MRPLVLPPRLKNPAAANWGAPEGVDAPDWAGAFEAPAVALNARVKLSTEVEEMALERLLVGGGGTMEMDEGRETGGTTAIWLEEEAKEDVLAHAEEFPDMFPVGEGGTEKKSESSKGADQSCSGEADLVKEVKRGEPDSSVVGPAKEAASVDALGSSSSSLTSMTAGLSSSLLLGITNFFFLIVLESNRVLILAAFFTSESGSDFSSLTAI